MFGPRFHLQLRVAFHHRAGSCDGETRCNSRRQREFRWRLCACFANPATLPGSQTVLLDPVSTPRVVRRHTASSNSKSRDSSGKTAVMLPSHCQGGRGRVEVARPRVHILSFGFRQFGQGTKRWTWCSENERPLAQTGPIADFARITVSIQMRTLGAMGFRSEHSG